MITKDYFLEIAIQREQRYQPRRLPISLRASRLFTLFVASSHNGSGRDFGVDAAMLHLDSMAGAVGDYPRAGPTHYVFITYSPTRGLVCA
jgi:hypothetical protein